MTMTYLELFEYRFVYMNIEQNKLTNHNKNT